MTVWVVIWVVLMMFWLFFGSWWNYEAGKPMGLGNTLIPWLCVLILGLLMFGAIAGGPAVINVR